MKLSSSSSPKYSTEAEIAVLSSVARLGADHRGKVVVSGSHAGLLTAAMSAAAGIRAVILNDAGIGLHRAGIAGLIYLDAIGMAAAAVDVWSARVGDGADHLARGKISHANQTAQALGVHRGMSVMATARLLARAAMPPLSPPPVVRAAFLIARNPAQPDIWGLDCATLANGLHDGAIVVTGSHGGLPGGDSAQALTCQARAALFNDAGIGVDDAGTARLAVLAARGIVAATVEAGSAHIGDARSTWDSGIISRFNPPAAGRGARLGMSAQDFVALFATSDPNQ